MASVLIVEDEDYMRRYMVKLVSEHPLIDSIYNTVSGKEAIEIARINVPDIALLDIELNPEEGINGIEVAEMISAINPKTRFVFITGYAQYSLSSFVVHPYDYIVKPISRNKLMKTLDDLAENVQQNIDRHVHKIVLKTQTEMLLLWPENIIFIEKTGFTSSVHTNLSQSIYEVPYTLAELEALLPSNFLRIHRSFIANLDKVRKLKSLGSQAHEVFFYDCDKTAIFSRNQFEKYRHLFGRTS